MASRFQNHYICVGHVLAVPRVVPHRPAAAGHRRHRPNAVRRSCTSLSPDMPNMGSVLKGIGYKTAYFGKFEMDKSDPRHRSRRSTTAPRSSPTASTSSVPAATSAARRTAASTTIPSSPARASAGCASAPAKRGRPASRSSWSPASSILTTSCTANAQCPRRSPRFRSPVDAAGDTAAAGELDLPEGSGPSRFRQASRNRSTPRACPARSWNTRRAGMAGPARFRPIAKICGRIFYNYYLNTIQDVDRSLQEIVDVMNEMDLWRDTVVVFTADHGEMGGAHGGIKGKGPFVYEENVHVPLIIAHPAGKAGAEPAGPHQPSRPASDLRRTDGIAGQRSGRRRSRRCRATTSRAARRAGESECDADAPRRALQLRGSVHRRRGLTCGKPMDTQFTKRTSGRRCPRRNWTSAAFSRFAFDGRYQVRPLLRTDRVQHAANAGGNL